MSKLFPLFLSSILIGMCVPLNITNKQSSSSSSRFLEKFHQNDYIAKFERAELVRYNKQYLRWFDVVTFKYNRSVAAFNASWTYKIDIGNHLDIVVQGYKFASNEYRLFPMRFRFNACEGYKANVGGSQNTIRCGNYNGCPMRKNVNMSVCNFAPDGTRLPPFIPSGSYMLEVQGISISTEVFYGYIYGIVERHIPWQ